MGLFSKKIIDQESIEWQLEHFEVLIRQLSTGPGLPDAELQLPTRENFLDKENPDRVYKGQELAEFLLNKVKAQCGIPEVKVKLVPTKESKPENIGGSVILQTTDQNAAAGRYIVEKDETGEYQESITYDQDLTRDPAQLIATLAHELSHLLHNRARELPEFDPPILYEMFTDLTAVYLGYGVFLSNGRFSYESTNEAWKSDSTGYLSEAELIVATAIFLQIKRIDPENAGVHLKKHLQKMLKNAFKQLAQYEDKIELLRKMEPDLHGAGSLEMN